jgi:hypothetical protein
MSQTCQENITLWFEYDYNRPKLSEQRRTKELQLNSDPIDSTAS